METFPSRNGFTFVLARSFRSFLYLVGRLFFRILGRNIDRNDFTRGFDFEVFGVSDVCVRQ